MLCHVIICYIAWYIIAYYSMWYHVSLCYIIHTWACDSRIRNNGWSALNSRLSPKPKDFEIKTGMTLAIRWMTSWTRHWKEERVLKPSPSLPSSSLGCGLAYPFPEPATSVRLSVQVWAQVSVRLLICLPVSSHAWAGRSESKTVESSHR